MCIPHVIPFAKFDLYLPKTIVLPSWILAYILTVPFASVEPQQTCPWPYPLRHKTCFKSVWFFIASKVIPINGLT